MVIKIRPFIESLLIKLVIIISCFILSFLSNSIDCNYFVFFCITLYFGLTMKTNCAFLLKYAGLLVSVALGLVGVFIVETNRMWLVELQKYSHYAGSLPLFASYYLLFMFCLELFDKKNSARYNNGRILKVSCNHVDFVNTILDFFAYFFFIVTFLMLAKIIPHPYFVVHLDRFAYRATYVTGIWQKLYAYYAYFIPLLLMNWHRNRHRKLTVATFATYGLYLFVQGEKYGAHMTALFYVFLYLIPEIERKHKDKLKKALKYMAVFICAALCFTIFQYQALYSYQSPLETIYSRIAEQGQLWWAIYDAQKEQGIHLSEVSDELDAYTDDGSDATPYYAIYKIMYLSAPFSLVTDKIATGSTYTESTAASLYYYFGVIALPLFAVVMAWFFAFLSFKYANYIRRKCIIEALIVSRLLTVVRLFFGMSQFTWLFDAKTLFTVAVWGVLIVIRRFSGARDNDATSLGRLRNSYAIRISDCTDLQC